MRRLLTLALLAACAPKQPERSASAGSASGSSPPATAPATSMPLVAADVAPCVLAKEGNPNSRMKPHDEPKRGQSFQGVDCNGAPADVQLLDFGDDGELAWQASILRGQLGGDSEEPSYSPFVMMAHGSRLALIASPRPSPLVGILRDHGFVEITHATNSSLAEPTDADLQRWKTLIACDLAEQARYCTALDEFARGSAPRPVAGVRAGASLVVVPQMPPESEFASYLRWTDGELAYGRIESYDSDDLRTRSFLFLRTLRGEPPVAGATKQDVAPLVKRLDELGAGPGHAAHVLARSLAYDEAGTHVFLRATATGYVAIEKPARAKIVIGVFAR